MKIRKIIIDIICVVLGIFMLYAGYNHIAKPDFYAAMIPPFISDHLAHYFSAVAEALVGIMLILPKTRKNGILLFTILMIVFLPIHTWDLLRDNHAENPNIPTMKIAVIRFMIQLAVIGLGFWMWSVKRKLAKRQEFMS